MLIRDGLIANLRGDWSAWRVGRRRGDGLTQEQIAALVFVAWVGPPAYRWAQPGNRVVALRMWRRAMRVYRHQRQPQDVSAAGPATVRARRWSFPIGVVTGALVGRSDESTARRELFRVG